MEGMVDRAHALLSMIQHICCRERGLSMRFQYKIGDSVAVKKRTSGTVSHVG